MHARRRLFTAMGAAWAAGVLPGTGRAASPPQPATPAIGTQMVLPSVRLLDGREIAPTYWQGKVLVVETWASWCPFCARQNPEIDRLHRAHVASGLEVLGLSIDRRPEDAVRYMRERGFAFHAAMLDAKWQAVLGRPKGLPVLWVVGRSGRLEQLEIGEMFPEDVADLARWLKDGTQG